MGKISAMHSLVDNCRLPFASEMLLPQPMQIIVMGAMLKTIIDTCHYKYVAYVLAQYCQIIATFLLHKYAMQESPEPFIF